MIRAARPVLKFLERTTVAFCGITMLLPLTGTQGRAQVQQALAQWESTTKKYMKELQTLKDLPKSWDLESEAAELFAEAVELVTELLQVGAETIGVAQTIFARSKALEEVAQSAHYLQTVSLDARLETDISVLAEQIYKMEINLDDLGDE